MADIGQVNVGEGDGKGGGEGAGVGLLDEVLLGDGVDDRRVVGAGDGDDEGLRRGAAVMVGRSPTV